jgi:hypothetical protein
MVPAKTGKFPGGETQNLDLGYLRHREAGGRGDPIFLGLLRHCVSRNDNYPFKILLFRHQELIF